MIALNKASCKQAQKVKLLIGNSNSLESQKLLQRFEIFLPRVEQVIEQTQRRDARTFNFTISDAIARAKTKPRSKMFNSWESALDLNRPQK